MSRGRRGARLGRALLVAVPLVFFGLFFVYPVATIVAEGLRPGGSWDLAVIGEVAGDGRYQEVAWFTLYQAILSTVLTVVIALPAAWVFARLEFRGRRLLWAAMVVPFVLPTVVVGAAFRALAGPDVEGLAPVLAAHVFFNYAVVVRTVGGFWAGLDPDLEGAARSAGAGPWGAFRRVTLPLLVPAVGAAASIVFLFTFTSFGVVMVLGGPRVRTLETEIYAQTARYLALDVAAVLCLLQLVAIVAVLVVFTRWQRRHRAGLAADVSDRGRRPVSGPADALGLALNLVVMAALLGAPLVVLAWRALDAPGGVGFGNLEALGRVRAGSTAAVDPLEAIRNSLVIAAAATALALVVGLAASVVVARRRGRWTGWFDVALMLPLGTSAVTVGFGFLVALDQPPLDLRRSVVLLPIAHAVVATPLVVRVCAPALASVDPALRDSAAILGASPLRSWRAVELPLVGRAVAVAAGFAFAVSLGEFGATLFLARADLPTVPVLIFRSLGQPGEVNRGAAYAASLVLAVLVCAGVLAAERVQRGVAAASAGTSARTGAGTGAGATARHGRGRG